MKFTLQLNFLRYKEDLIIETSKLYKGFKNFRIDLNNVK